jgi:hypothetical protein
MKAKLIGGLLLSFVGLNLAYAAECGPTVLVNCATTNQGVCMNSYTYSGNVPHACSWNGKGCVTSGNTCALPAAAKTQAAKQS